MATGDTGKNNDNNNVYIENYNSNTVLYNNNQQVKIERMNDFDHATNNPTAVPITLSSMSTSTMAPNVTTTLPSSHQISFYDPFNQNSINNYSPFPQTTYKYEAIRTRSPSLNGTDYNPIQTTSPAYANILTANFDPQLHPNLPYSRNNGNIFAPTIMNSGPVNPLDTTVPPPPATMATEATMVGAASVFDSNNNTTPATHSNKSNIDNTATSNATSTSTTSNIGSHKQRSYSHSSASSSSSSHSRPHHATHTRAHSYSSYKSGASLPSTTVANYQPYPGLISRANLIILGDLDTIMADWQPEEIHQKRRLVQFQRSHIGQDIQCSFRAILAEEYMNINNNNDPMIEDHPHQPPPSSQQQQMIKEHHHHHMDQFKLHHQQQSPHTIVSCIYWDEKNEFYVTSVDCIHLLEDLMNVRFTVEEKNRVRRNLEGFRPLTVSKCKAESAEFFKLIMSFPNPKPRNIEKDVKVFPWRTLPYALKKIVTKYTASPYSMHDHCPTTNTTAPTTTTTTSSPSSSSPVSNSSSIPRFASNTMNPSSSPSITSPALTMTPTTSVSTSQLMNISPRINSFNAPSRYQQRRASAPPKHFESLNEINMCTYDYSSSSHHIPSTTTTSNNNNINTNANHHHHSFQIRPLSTTDTLSTFQLQRLNLPQMDGSQFNLTGLVDQSDAMNSTNTTATSADTTTATAPIATNNMNGTQHYQSNN
ncbi:hypothetical protein BJ944DRAFT_288025 [Cunninghamella echinulata]|nr:hypothetical protein BJ944DRAFT_288025 [Cunninghamella echinulata]